MGVLDTTSSSNHRSLALLEASFCKPTTSQSKSGSTVISPTVEVHLSEPSRLMTA